MPEADVYLVGEDPLHKWAIPRRRRYPWAAGLELSVAPPEYVVLRKLEYFREGGSTKHVTDINTIRSVTGLDENLLSPWLDRLGLRSLWEQMIEGPGDLL